MKIMSVFVRWRQAEMLVSIPSAFLEMMPSKCCCSACAGKLFCFGWVKDTKGVDMG